MNAQSYDHEKWITVKEALRVSGYGNSYLRMHLLKEGKIESKREMIPGTSIERILIDRQSFEAWIKNHERADVVRVTKSEYDEYLAWKSSH